MSKNKKIWKYSDNKYARAFQDARRKVAVDILRKFNSHELYDSFWEQSELRSEGYSEFTLKTYRESILK
jgi:hypothetical protein